MKNPALYVISDLLSEGYYKNVKRPTAVLSSHVPGSDGLIITEWRTGCQPLNVKKAPGGAYMVVKAKNSISGPDFPAF